MMIGDASNVALSMYIGALSVTRLPCPSPHEDPHVTTTLVWWPRRWKKSLTLSCPPLRKQTQFRDWFDMVLVDRQWQTALSPKCPCCFCQTYTGRLPPSPQTCKISTGNRHDLGSGNAKLQPEAARESCGEVCEVYSMQNHNLIGSNRHLQPTDGFAVRSLTWAPTLRSTA